MITFTHLEFGWYLLCYSLLWILVVIGACWVTRAITLDRAAAAEFATQERKAGGRHRIIPDDSGRPLGKPDTVPLNRVTFNFPGQPVTVELPAEMCEQQRRRCSHCGFGVQVAADGKACKSGSACPFSGQLVRYAGLPPGAQPPLRELTRAGVPSLREILDAKRPETRAALPESWDSAARRAGRTTDQIAAWEADTDRFIAAMRGEM